MNALRGLDHPFLFIVSMVLVVTAGQKVGAYLSGKAGLKALNAWFLNK